MLQQKEKYLFFDFNIYGGMDDCVALLELMMVAALSTKRILIIKETETASQHRTSKKYIPFDWDNYIDLEQTKIAKIMSNGTIKEIKSTFRWEHEKNFNFKSYAREQIRYIDTTQLYDSENKDYSMLYVSKPSISKLKKNKAALKAKGIKISHYYNLIYKASHHVSLAPSQKVNELSDIVLSHFGTNRQSSRYLQTVLNSKHRLKKHDFEMNYYICMHLRANDSILYFIANYYAVQKEQIAYIIKKVCHYHHNIPIYIMSDMPLSYFDFLKPQYKIYTYRDFPILKDLFSSSSKAIDHNLLYAVEKNIMKYALVKIFPSGRNKLMFDGNASYEIPPHITASFESSKKTRLKKHRSIVYKNRMDKIIMMLKSLRKKFGI